MYIFFSLDIRYLDILDYLDYLSNFSTDANRWPPWVVAAWPPSTPSAKERRSRSPGAGPRTWPRWGGSPSGISGSSLRRRSSCWPWWWGGVRRKRWYLRRSTCCRGFYGHSRTWWRWVKWPGSSILKSRSRQSACGQIFLVANTLNN